VEKAERKRSVSMEASTIALILDQRQPLATMSADKLARVGLDTPRPLVRRGKAPIFSGCNSRPARVAPAGSNRSGSGGNETAEASDAKGRQGDSASRQAVTRVNAEQASKRVMWEPTQQRDGEGRRRRF